MRIGFIGLGIMGKPMAANLLKKGYNIIVNDLNHSAVDELKGLGADTGLTPKQVAVESDIIITMLPNNAIVKSVILGEDGIIHGAKEGSIVVDMSSISPVTATEIADALKKQGIEMLDAPVSGGEPKAIDGTLSVMAGGNENAFNQVRPILACMGKDITWVGPSGSGATAKLANQIMVNVNIAAMSEALVLAAKAGIDIEKMYQAIRGGLAGSAVLDAKLPMIIERNFQAGGRVDINLKDLTNVMETADAFEMSLPLTEHVKHIFESLKKDGKQADDHGGIVQYYEKLAGVEVRKA
ncbi:MULTISPECIES: 2-hydroxy-3-oxopropionate reductase [unclassified Paenibacillus]|uniref:2-hydroxy-3-oxopropionate reductase n=1 Tax=Paenibacillus provencensis TaxID=441151 RepID=A0ABW3PPV0_9BACL|nr:MULTISPECIES: 2-hydroxy-3-oxopropionate reductase [unclassified Paenibacillus]MCM3126851.1 2-hydroxy-3-oxopropionate reductase [Paenibacillus sp. MER 78]SFS57632.1 2-hydroxy-3-oxopropionate reductase [Paenibacillus sp. 453mf]